MAGDLTQQIVFGADTTGVEAGVGRVNKTLAGLGTSAATAGKQAAAGIDEIGKGAAASAQKVDSATKNMVASIQRQIAATEAGTKSGRQFQESLAAQRGVSVDALKPYLDQLDAVTAKAKVATLAASKLTSSLGATDFGNGAAIPKKLTLNTSADRALASASTSLGATAFGAATAEAAAVAATANKIKSEGIKEAAHEMERFGFHTAAAKRELLVLAHELSQGNYKRFGGSLLVLGEQTGAASLLFSKAALAAGGLIAVIAALGIALYKGSNESVEYAKALTLTGNYLGKTTDQMKEMAAQVAKTTGTQHQAAAALTEIAQSGKIASTSMTEVAAAVVSMNRVLGTSVEEATAIFVKLAEEPAKASAKLNESLHYLTQTTYERIRALEEQGRGEEAASLAQKTLAEETNLRLAKVEAQAGLLSRAWRALANDAIKAWDGMMGLGRAQSVGERLATAQKNLEDLKARGPIGGPVTGKSDFAEQMKNAQAAVNDLSRRGLREQDNAEMEGERTRANDAKIAASQRLADQKKATRSRADQRKEEIDQLNRDAKTVGLAKDEYDKRVAAINEKYKDPKGPKGKAFTDDAGTRMLETLRQTEASIKAQLAGEEKLTEAQKEQAKFQQLIADLKEKKVLTADQKSLLAGQGAINAQLAVNVAVEHELELKKEAEQLDKTKIAYAKQLEAITKTYQSANANRSEQYDRVLSTAGMGDRARQEVEAQKSIYKEFNQYKLTLDKETADKSTDKFDAFNTDLYKNKVVELKGALNDALDAQKAFYAADKAAREDWRNGANKALANYIDDINDAAKRAQSLVATGLNGLTDGITRAVMGDKGASFKDLGKNIASQIVHGMVQTQITKPVADWLQGSLKDGDSIISKLLGGLTGGKGGGLGSLLGGGAGTASAATATTSLATAATSAASALASLTAAAGGSSISSGGSGISSILGAASGSSVSAMAGANAVGASGGDSLGALIALNGWANGGYTGNGGKYQPAGIVHAGEYVVNADSTAKLGIGFLDRLNRRGYADGGFVSSIMGGNLSRPGQSGAGGSGRVINLTMNVPEGTDTKTAGQWGAAAMRRIRMDEARHA